MIPSLEEYVLVSQAGPRVESYRRNDAGHWDYRAVTEGRLELACGAVIDLDTLYAALPE